MEFVLREQFTQTLKISLYQRSGLNIKSRSSSPVSGSKKMETRKTGCAHPFNQLHTNYFADMKRVEGGVACARNGPVDFQRVNQWIHDVTLRSSRPTELIS